MILNVTCEIRRNVPMEGYLAVEGKNLLVLNDEHGNEINRNISDVLWMGKGSPFPTPPGGPWKAEYVPAHPRFGQCFFVRSDRETDIFIHYAARKSYGCLIINPTPAGRLFMQSLIEHRDGLVVVQHNPVDNRSDKDRAANPIDYTKMTKKIV